MKTKLHCINRCTSMEVIFLLSPKIKTKKRLILKILKSEYLKFNCNGNFDFIFSVKSEAVELLLKNGANVNALNNKNETVLHQAVNSYRK